MERYVRGNVERPVALRAELCKQRTRAELFRQVRDDHAWSIEGKSVHYWVTVCTGMSASRYLESVRANAGRSSWGGFLEAALLANKLSIRVHMSDAL